MYDTVILEYEGKFGRGRTVDDIVSWVETIPPDAGGRQPGVTPCR